MAAAEEAPGLTRATAKTTPSEEARRSARVRELLTGQDADDGSLPDAGYRPGSERARVSRVPLECALFLDGALD
jgi:hypothetical protein